MHASSIVCMNTGEIRFIEDLLYYYTNSNPCLNYTFLALNSAYAILGTIQNRLTNKFPFAPTLAMNVFTQNLLIALIDCKIAIAYRVVMKSNTST